MKSTAAGLIYKLGASGKMKLKLSDICMYRNGKVDIKDLNAETYISTENMLPNKGGITETASLPTVSFTQEYKKGDVLVSNIRPYFKKIWRAKNDGGCSNDVLVFQANENIDKGFLYYVLANDDFFAYSMATSKGTKMPRGDKFSIMRYEVPNFDLKTQSRIAAVLSALDDKIELNTKINENLEQQAQAIFKSWFVDFEPFGGVMPQDWKKATLNDVCKKITDGSHYSPKDDPSANIPMLSVKDMLSYGFSFQSCKHIDEDEFQKMIANDCVPLKDDILVAKDGSYLKEIFICNCKQRIAILSSIAIFRPNTEIIIPEILLALLKSPAVLQEVKDNYVSGSVLPRIVLKDFKKLRLILPSMKVQEQVAPILHNIRLQIDINCEENTRLSALRDTLLPKLMNGEIDVSAVKI